MTPEKQEERLEQSPEWIFKDEIQTTGFHGQSLVNMQKLLSFFHGLQLWFAKGDGMEGLMQLDNNFETYKRHTFELINP